MRHRCCMGSRASSVQSESKMHNAMLGWAVGIKKLSIELLLLNFV